MSPMRLRSFVSPGGALRTGLALSVLLGGALALDASRPRVADGVTVCAANDPALAEVSARRFAAHPPHGGATETGAQAVTATFQVSNFVFNADGNAATAIDTVRINTGESVRFNWVAGIHSTTSGNASDLDAGSLWDLPLDVVNPTQVVAFPNAGTFPFFCVYHSLFNMAGVVVVTAPAGVGPQGQPKVGFVAPPSPNPTRGEVSVRFAVASAGHARVTAFDAGGRAIATLFDQDVAPGTYSATWIGKSGAGERLAPGAYFLRLSAPGVHETRRITVVR
jgi:plastocyanin